MPKLKDAMQEQINRMTEEEESNPLPNAEIKNLLEAFILMINAYLQRLGETDETPERWPKVSDTFGSLG